MSEYTPRVVLRPGTTDVYGVIDLTQRQVELIMGALATLSTDGSCADGYPMYSDLFDSVEQMNKAGFDIELNPYIIGTLQGEDPTKDLRAAIDALNQQSAA